MRAEREKICVSGHSQVFRGSVLPQKAVSTTQGWETKHRTYQCGTASHDLTRHRGPLGVGRRVRERAVEVRLQTSVERPQDRVQLQGRERDQRSGRVSSRGRRSSRGGGSS